jgi:hypothetical protein
MQGTRYVPHTLLTFPTLYTSLANCLRHNATR